MMTEVRPGVTTGRIPAAEIIPDALWYTIPLSLAADAAVVLGATEENWLPIGKSALLAAGLMEITDADARGTYLEILAQATSGLAESLAARLGKPVATLPAQQIKAGATTGMIAVDIALNEPGLNRLYLAFSPGLERELTPASPKRPEPSATVIRRPELEKSRTLDLLMEVELPVSVSFGRAELPLRDVLKLNSGSIVELNRTISDPVEIIVNNCVIARGEVVVVEGNYGVRIRQVVSREERLRTLR